MRLIGYLLGCILMTAACAQTPQRSVYRWTQFVQVEGQLEPVPVEWVSTPEGKFAHSIKIPNPVPKDSGYQSGMSSKEYFEHLCKIEAGEFIFKTVENVEGFYFMRPPKRPTDDDLMDRYKLEAPEIERFFQLLRPMPIERAEVFVNPPWANYKYVEEPAVADRTYPFVRSSGYRQRSTSMTVEVASALQSRYGLVWRGIQRTNDRDLGISGGEWIVVDLSTTEVLAVMRNYGLTGRTPNTSTGIWWLNALQCQGFKKIVTASDKGRQLYEFFSRVVKPVSGESK